ncbi:hypothetical protein [Micromonospora sp. C41]|uniref:hypothetical protein n=1 Tax=Micromonospora sp. C41 TaxID=2824878 RepID=UPI001B35FB90|nr:hypothetical protein [Micromonospora sp. C41]MBQ1064454.1 hypothetical protein [Micromonospora sp. C41]
MEIVLLWCFVIAYFAKRGAEDLVHAVKGTPNPRYELKRERARAAGQVAASQPRYGTREWFADLYSDALVAHTEKRRRAAAAKAQPVDDMVDVVREPRRDREQQRRNAEREVEHDEPEWLTPDRGETAGPSEVVHDDQHPYCLEPCGPTCGPFGWVCGSCGAERKHFVSRYEAEKAHRAHVCPRTDSRDRCPDCGAPNPFGTPCQQHNPATDDDTPTARIYQFPNINQFEKEITMADTEVTSLATAMAYAELASKAHESFATAGAEPYVASLENAGMTGEAVGSARAAAEASANAAAMWSAHRSLLEQQMSVKEAYQSQPDAADKEFLLNG